MGVAKMTTPYQILKNSNLVTERAKELACVVKQRKAVAIATVPSGYKIVITRALGMYGIY